MGTRECVFSCSLLNDFVASCWGADGNVPRAESGPCFGLVLVVSSAVLIWLEAFSMRHGVKSGLAK